uniref:LAGLIDADG endonuclease n=1 Tax=Morchella brunnea TaxID=1174671 RepID=A0A8K1I7Y9_9PEZI|nr:LAGLIDADG endonuclease [Morchella brunnea]UBU98531.1 LAGLIDADG endonuclease [Morchella brunnea]
MAGFTSGEGCFFVSIYNSSTCKSGEAVMLKFQIAQHSRDSELMRSLITNLGCGRIELNLGRSAVYFVVTKFKDITEKIIPFFVKYPLQGVKVKDFEDFKRVTKLMENKARGGLLRSVPSERPLQP